MSNNSQVAQREINERQLEQAKANALARKKKQMAKATKKVAKKHAKIVLKKKQDGVLLNIPGCYGDEFQVVVK